MRYAMMGLGKPGQALARAFARGRGPGSSR